MEKRFKNKKVAVIGFEINGIDAVNFLLKEDAKITVFDKKSENQIDKKGFDKKGVKFILGDDYLSNGLNDFDYIFRSPAVYRFLPEIVDAEIQGAVVTSPVKLFLEICQALVIGVTGTKGKGTTCTLINEILNKSKRDVYLAGNIGKPVLSLLPKLNRDSIVVLELSSFQLIDVEKSPNIAVVLNITSDHLDWHTNREEYVNAKKNIVKYQNESDFAVLNFDYESSKSFENDTEAMTYFFSKKYEVSGSYIKDGKILLDLGDYVQEVGNTSDLTLRGQHNWENITASIIASSLAGADTDSIQDAVFSFRGLEHRLEFVRKASGISYYNDSISTNPQTVLAAANSFNESITIILGGYDKGLEYGEMAIQLSKLKNLENIILIGDIKDKLKDVFEQANFKGNLVDMNHKTMLNVVIKSSELTKKGGVVLLSPGTSSFDMFDSYKDRGNQFKSAVNKL